MRTRQFLKPRLVPRDVEAIVDNLPMGNIGSAGYDPWGLNPDTAKITFTLVRWLYDHYFRVVANGLENVAPEGRLLLVGNHGGQLPVDGVLVSYAVASRNDGARLPRSMIERWFPSVPFLGNWMNSVGGVIGDPKNCAKMLERDEAIVVFPEGIRGSGKPYHLRYQLQRFGHGFMHLAMEHDAPIVPVGVVGCEETMPSLANIKPVARMLGMPYFPLSPLVPLPARVVLNFGKPMHFANDVRGEADVARRVEQVKDAIRDLIDAGVAQRQHLF
ncbi:lysophospholipid acyltransferase family protein [Salinisphaera sp. Q1T1-3]|uniref:lysophospholipid acyltransferase family protein n=1 Tax=Salinisphaera sp. Q1T1-3 TaxID=2321229 RepID=UPI000E745F95|nr:lysophospholipid acyltransferase family protein [Salinisphaera sp. Q1T1-3]RJS92892.1 acyltransferase family protein [Salinisphaera sp. Q1T1-3]